MFTGIVEETGSVLAFAPQANAWRLTVDARVAAEDAALGDSIAVNGCCLTLVQAEAGRLHFDILEETRRLTNFAGLRPGAAVNLERSLRAGGKIGGHFVTGHIDTTGTVETMEPRGKDTFLRVRHAPEFARLAVHKGSIALDGISLTIAETGPASLAVWLIPHTLEVTNLREKRVGDPVNLEFDLLAKHVDKLLASRGP
ncbi:MAG TPA: riboflavin synthase [Opitutaceae bacterium]|nr:riboflavin synthase [Opitutaceae bacterium]